MPIHFAGSRRPATSVLARAFSRPVGARACNDNGVGGGTAASAPAIDTPLLRATLEHFAAHGLGAAGEAHDRAMAASGAGEAAEHHHWMAVCRMLDRRMPARRGH